MNEDNVKGKLNDVKGRAERQAGEWTGDKDLQAEGMKDQVKGKVQDAVGKVKDAGRDVADKFRDRDNDNDNKDRDVA
jgi:uncharacterized protein YjbJ (UPF0337 family)